MTQRRTEPPYLFGKRRYTSLWKKAVWFSLFGTAVLLAFPKNVNGWSYPKDGRFKKIKYDPWFYVDERWDIRAPDKFVHAMGSYASCEVLSRVFERRPRWQVAAFVMTYGLYKEYGDAFREGWSARDLMADALGIGTWVVNRKTTGSRFYVRYDTEKVQFIWALPVK